MKNKNIFGLVLSWLLLMGLWIPSARSLAAEPQLGPLGVVSNSTLSPEEYASLETLDASLNQLGRKLRIQLRGLRTQSGVNSSSLFRIERLMGKVQSAFKRMLKISRGRSHVSIPLRILLDDLERQLAALREEQYALLRQLNNGEVDLGEAADRELLDGLVGYIGTLAEAVDTGQRALQ